ncbi:DUF4350 domain-containing protein [Nonomuraea sp. NPDC050663]|uniref:DUF4350 domain-containing protein n=1 Tax=Nonomuraea sp. NPDC050663 TaxID=3364370 RepID=UPI0037AEFAC8
MTTSTSPTTRGIWRSLRAPLLVGVLLLVAATIGVLLSGGAREARYLDPDDTSLSGGKALAQLLRARGVTVDRVDSVDAAMRLGGDRLILVTGNVYHDDLNRLSGDLLIDAASVYLEDLASEVRRGLDGARVRSREPECDLPAARAAGSVFLGGSPLSGPSRSVGCYPSPDGATLLTYAVSGRNVTVVGDMQFMTNMRLDEDGNAALALNLAGSKSAVTWLVNPPSEEGGAVGGDKSIYDLMSPNVGWGVVMALIALLVTIVWRARRLGPVVVEKLPVVVRAAESVEGHGGLYRARRARDRASAALRAGTLARVVPRLGLTVDSGADAVVSAIAVRTGQDPHLVGAALYGPPPADDGALVGLAGYLDQLERQISER